ncbi:MAG TPA: response regulator transcription factor [Gaiellaceae bacterium]
MAAPTRHDRVGLLDRGLDRRFAHRVQLRQPPVHASSPIQRPRSHPSEGRSVSIGRVKIFPMSMRRNPTSCLVADDHPAMVEAICEVLAEQGIEVTGRARDGEEALQKIETRKPDVAVVDLRMPRLSGVEIARRAGVSAPETGVIVYTAYGERALLTEALDAGARGFVLKEAPLDDLVRAVETVASGGSYVDPVLAGVLASSSTVGDLPTLTTRERDVLRLLADGHSNEEIGKRLFISPETVRTHIRKAMDKLDADTRTQAVAKALRQSLIA